MPWSSSLQKPNGDLVGRPLFTGAADEGYTPSNGQGEARVLADAAGQPVDSYFIYRPAPVWLRQALATTAPARCRLSSWRASERQR
jgi:hypothetical protein